MTASGRVRLPAIIRIAALLAMLAVVGAVALLVERGLRTSGGPKAEVPAAGPAPGARAENISHLEFKSGKLAVEIRADASSSGESGLLKFVGRVRIEAVVGRPGRMTAIDSAEATYDPEHSLFRIPGAFEAGDGRISIKASSPAAAAVLDAGSGRLEITGGFEAAGAGGGVGPGFSVTGRSLEYDVEAMTGEASGRVEASSGDLSILAGSARFSLDASGRLLGRAEFGGRVALGSGRGENGGRAFELNAGSIAVAFQPGTGRPSTLDATTAVDLAAVGAGGLRMVLTGPECRLAFDERGGAASLEASKGASIILAGPSAPDMRIDGASISWSASSDTLAAAGSFTTEDDRMRLEGRDMSFERADGRLEASGGVKGYLKPGGRDFPSGLFQAAAPIYIVGGRLVSSGKAGLLKLEQGARIWQEKAGISADGIGFDAGSGDMTASGRIAISFADDPPAKPGEAGMEKGSAPGIKAGEMTYSASARRAVLKGGTSVAGRAFSAVSAEATAVFSAGPSGLETLAMEKGVSLTCRGYRGTCGLALYEPAKGLLTMTGEPSLRGAGAESIRGDKLTIKIPDDKIFVERRGKGRSVILLEH